MALELAPHTFPTCTPLLPARAQQRFLPSNVSSPSEINSSSEHMLRMLTSISVTVRSTDRKIREAWHGRLADRGIWRTSWTSKRFQGHFYSGSGSPKTLLAAYCWYLAAVPRADDTLYTFCQGGGCSPSTSQMKQTWGAGCQHCCGTARARRRSQLPSPTRAAGRLPPRTSALGGIQPLVASPLALRTLKSCSRRTALGWNLNSSGDVKKPFC